MRNKAPICELCKNFGHIARFCRMDIRNLNKNQNYRRNNNNNNNKNHRGNINRQREEIKEHAEEFKEVLVKAKEPTSSFVVV